MAKRKALDLQNHILEIIKKNPGITLSSLERKAGTNPKSLKEHCQQLSKLGLIKITKTEHTTILITKK